LTPAEQDHQKWGSDPLKQISGIGRRRRTAREYQKNHQGEQKKKP